MLFEDLITKQHNNNQTDNIEHDFSMDSFLLLFFQFFFFFNELNSDNGRISIIKLAMCELAIYKHVYVR